MRDVEAGGGEVKRVAMDLLTSILVEESWSLETGC